MDTPRLKLLMSAYMHEDYQDQGGRDGTVALFLSHGDAPAARQLAEEIDDVLTLGLSEPELDRFLEDMGNYADLTRVDLTYTAWLQEIREQARRFDLQASSLQ